MWLVDQLYPLFSSSIDDLCSNLSISFKFDWYLLAIEREISISYYLRKKLFFRVKLNSICREMKFNEWVHEKIKKIFALHLSTILMMLLSLSSVIASSLSSSSSSSKSSFVVWVVPKLGWIVGGFDTITEMRKIKQKQIIKCYYECIKHTDDLPTRMWMSKCLITS